MNAVFEPLPTYVYVDGDNRLVVAMGKLEDFARYVDLQLVKPMAELINRPPAFTTPPRRRKAR